MLLIPKKNCSVITTSFSSSSFFFVRALLIAWNCVYSYARKGNTGPYNSNEILTKTGANSLVSNGIFKRKKNGKTTSFDFFQNHLYFSGSRLLIMIATFLCAFFLHLSIYAGFVSFLFYAYDFFSGLCSSSFVSAYRLILLAVIRSSFVVIYCPYGMFHIFLLPFCKLVLVFSTILFFGFVAFFLWAK